MGELFSAGPDLSWLARLESDYCLRRMGLCVPVCYTDSPSSPLGPFVSPTEQIDDNLRVPQRQSGRGSFLAPEMLGCLRWGELGQGEGQAYCTARALLSGAEIIVDITL